MEVLALTVYKGKKYNCINKHENVFEREVSTGMQLKFLIGTEENRHDVSVQIQRAGRESCDANKKKINWKTKWNSVHFIREGRGILKLGEKEFFLREGMCFVLYAGVHYEYYQDKSNPWKYDWIDFSGENVDILLAKCGFSVEQPYMHYRMDKYFLNELNRFFEIYNVHSIRDICVVAQFFKLISELIQCNGGKNRFRTDVSTRFWRVRDCMIYINNNFRMDLTLEEIAKSNNISVSYMMAIWSKEIDMSPIEYMHAIRISEACVYLKNKGAKIKEIAAQVGYSDEKYFMRVFKKYKGVTPSEYREFSEEKDAFSWLKERNLDFRSSW